MKRTALVAVALFVLVAAFFAWGDMRNSIREATSWTGTVVTQGEISAIYWVSNHTRMYEPVVYDIFGGETMMALTLRTPPVGGDWAVSPHATQNMGNATAFYETDSAQEAAAIMKQFGAKYAIVPKTRDVHAGWKWLRAFSQKFDETLFFTKVFENADALVVAVK
ncbi:TPA: hypothetical protein HA318_05045 [Candidatus Micrarchaeota archaeon]|nr:MAG: hypothetical protein AUJ65_05890 [Candidatus Micrarchaeota archaeon CG1_02_51_15]HII39339.1 hypothetical protein [Candidatus Micrarchaeota archaeon]